MIGYLVAGAVAVAVGIGIVRHRRKRRAEEEQRAEEQRRVDAVRKQQRETIEQREIKEREEETRRQAEAKAEEDRRALAAEKRAALVARFKELFGKTFVEANAGWARMVLEAEVDSMLHATAYALHEAFKREQECRNNGIEGSAMLGATTVSAQLKKRFWELFHVACDLELPVRWHIMPNRDNPNRSFVAILGQTVKDQMVMARPELRGQRSKVSATYRAYVSPIDAGFFTGDVSFCNVSVVNSVATRFDESVDVMTVGAK